MPQVRSLSLGAVPDAGLGLGSLILGSKPNSVRAATDNGSRRCRCGPAARARPPSGMIASSVEHTGNGSAAARLNTVAEWLGYLGVAPLVLCLAGVGLLPDYRARELAQRIALAWGAVLLAFTGAVHLGLALAGRLPWEPRRVGAAALPAVWARRQCSSAASAGSRCWWSGSAALAVRASRARRAAAAGRT